MFLTKLCGYDETKTTSVQCTSDLMTTIKNLLTQAGVTVDAHYDSTSYLTLTDSSATTSAGMGWIAEVIANGVSIGSSISYKRAHQVITFTVDNIKYGIALFNNNTSSFSTSSSYIQYAIFADFRGIESNLLDDSRCMFYYMASSMYSSWSSSTTISGYLAFVEVINVPECFAITIRKYADSDPSTYALIGHINWGNGYRTVYPFGKDVFLDKGDPLISTSVVSTSTVFSSLLSSSFNVGDTFSGTIPTGDVYYGYTNEGILTKSDTLISLPYDRPYREDVVLGSAVYRKVPFLTSVYYPYS